MKIINDDTGHAMTFEQSKRYLEQKRLLDRGQFLEELEQMHQREGYTPQRAGQFFDDLFRAHVGQRSSGYYGAARPLEDTRESYTDLPEGNCALLDWLNDLYWEEIDQHVVIRDCYPLGTLFYRAVTENVYVVVDCDDISVQEAANLEDANDIFGAAGSYSHLEYPGSEEDQRAAEVFALQQQGTIGGLYNPREGVWYPRILLPGQAGQFFFGRYREHEPLAYPHSVEAGFFLSDQKQALLFLTHRYPDIRLIEAWSVFEELATHRI